MRLGRCSLDFGTDSTGLFEILVVFIQNSEEFFLF